VIRRSGSDAGSSRWPFGHAPHHGAAVLAKPVGCSQTSGRLFVPPTPRPSRRPVCVKRPPCPHGASRIADWRGVSGGAITAAGDRLSVGALAIRTSARSASYGGPAMLPKTCAADSTGDAALRPGCAAAVLGGGRAPIFLIARFVHRECRHGTCRGSGWWQAQKATSHYPSISRSLLSLHDRHGSVSAWLAGIGACSPSKRQAAEGGHRKRRHCGGQLPQLALYDQATLSGVVPAIVADRANPAPSCLRRAPTAVTALPQG
jgi:hypothetical protein